jgi:hypothetical protein
VTFLIACAAVCVAQNNWTEELPWEAVIIGREKILGLCVWRKTLIVTGTGGVLTPHTNNFIKLKEALKLLDEYSWIDFDCIEVKIYYRGKLRKVIPPTDVNCLRSNGGSGGGRRKRDTPTCPFCECNRGTNGSVCADPHFMTFDGAAFSFQGECTYLLSQSDGGDGGQPFQIFGRFVKIQRYTKLGELTVVYDGSTIIIKRQGVVTVDGEEIQLTYSGNNYTIYEEDGYIVVETGSGLRVGYIDHRWCAFVECPMFYAQSTEGFLGNFDGDASNDLVTKDGSVVNDNDKGYCELGNSWQIEPEAQCPLKNCE